MAISELSAKPTRFRISSGVRGPRREKTAADSPASETGRPKMPPQAQIQTGKATARIPQTRLKTQNPSFPEFGPGLRKTGRTAGRIGLILLSTRPVGTGFGSGAFPFQSGGTGSSAAFDAPAGTTGFREPGSCGGFSGTQPLSLGTAADPDGDACGTLETHPQTGHRAGLPQWASSSRKTD